MILAVTGSLLFTQDAQVDVSKSRDTRSALIMSPPGIAWQGFNPTKYHPINFTIIIAWGKSFDSVAFGPVRLAQTKQFAILYVFNDLRLATV